MLPQKYDSLSSTLVIFCWFILHLLELLSIKREFITIYVTLLPFYIDLCWNLGAFLWIKCETRHEDLFLIDTSRARFGAPKQWWEVSHVLILFNSVFILLENLKCMHKIFESIYIFHSTTCIQQIFKLNTLSVCFLFCLTKNHVTEVTVPHFLLLHFSCLIYGFQKFSL